MVDGTELRVHVGGGDVSLCPEGLVYVVDTVWCGSVDFWLLLVVRGILLYCKPADQYYRLTTYRGARALRTSSWLYL